MARSGLVPGSSLATATATAMPLAQPAPPVLPSLAPRVPTVHQLRQPPRLASRAAGAPVNP
ncbi:MAG: hypothetical protein JXA83_15580 [Acidimicrobiales bacterium]|nr:hypothetical protein [Acidimicrobiales bacterium]